MKNNRFISALVRFMDGDVSFEPKAKETENRRDYGHKEKTIAERYFAWYEKNGYATFKKAYAGASLNTLGYCLISTPISSTIGKGTNWLTERLFAK